MSETIAKERNNQSWHPSKSREQMEEKTPHKQEGRTWVRASLTGYSFSSTSTLSTSSSSISVQIKHSGPCHHCMKIFFIFFFFTFVSFCFCGFPKYRVISLRCRILLSFFSKMAVRKYIWILVPKRTYTDVYCINISWVWDEFFLYTTTKIRSC